MRILIIFLLSFYQTSPARAEPLFNADSGCHLDQLLGNNTLFSAPMIDDTERQRTYTEHWAKIEKSQPDLKKVYWAPGNTYTIMLSARECRCGLDWFSREGVIEWVRKSDAKDDIVGKYNGFAEERFSDSDPLTFYQVADYPHLSPPVTLHNVRIIASMTCGLTLKVKADTDVLSPEEWLAIDKKVEELREYLRTHYTPVNYSGTNSPRLFNMISWLVGLVIIIGAISRIINARLRPQD